MLSRIAATIFLAGGHFISNDPSEVSIHLKDRRTGIRAQAAAYAGICINRDFHRRLPCFVVTQRI